MSKITTFVRLIDTKTGYANFRTTDIKMLYETLPPAEQQNKCFVSGQEILILEDTGKYVKWMVESITFRVMDREIFPPDLKELTGDENATPFNSELNVYLKRLDP